MKPNTSPRKHIAFAALTAAIIVLLTLSSCEDFFGTADLKESIRDEVVVATAENVPLTVRPDPSVPGGTTSLSSTTQKVGVPFDLSVTIFAEYAFAGWSEPSATGAVSFESAASPATTATITEAVDGIVIQADFTRRPELEFSDPFNFAESVFRNKTIQLYFSKPMDPASVSFANISITHKPYGSADPPESIADRYEEPVAAPGNILFRLVLKPGEMLSETHLVTLRISRLVTDAEDNTMAADAVINFLVSNEIDDVPPDWEATDPFTVRRGDGTPLGAGNATNSLSLTLRPRAFDNDMVLYLNLIEDDGITQPESRLLYGTDIPYTLQTTTQGSRTLTATVEDATGLTSTTNRQVSVIYDTQPPGVPSVATSDAPYENGGTYYFQTGGVDFSFNSSDSTSGIAGFTTDSGGSNPQSSINLTSTGTVYAVDNAGNVSSTGLSVVVDQDDIDPSITGDTVTGPIGPWVVAGDTFSLSFNVTDSGGSQLNGTPSVTVTSGGDAVSNSVTVGGAGPAYTASVIMAAGDSNGVIRYSITAEDNVGNSTTVGPADSGLDYDKNDPAQPSVAGHDADYFGGGTYYCDAGGVTFTFNSSDTGSGVAGFTTNSDGSNPQGSINLTSSDTVYAVDNAGNVSTGLVLNVAQDTTAPSQPSVATNNADYFGGGIYYSYSGNVAFTFSSGDTGSGVAGFTTNSDGSNLESPITLSDETDTVYAVDNMGNVSGGLSLTVERDNTKPGQPSVATNNADYYDGDTYYYDTGGVNFTFSSLEDGSGVAGFTTDSGGSNPQSSINLTSSDTVYAVDNVGNVSANGLSVSVEQDNTGPTIGGTLSATSSQITGITVTDAVSGVDTGSYASDGGATFNGTELTGLTALSDPGSLDYDLTVADLAGNTTIRTVRHSLSGGTYSATFP